jgi:histidinol-phosphatase (PHP family)
MPLLANFHTHTVFCDGTDTAEDMVRYAIGLGFHQLGFSGHMDPDNHVDPKLYFPEVRRLQEIYKDRIEIICGLELDTIYDPAAAEGADYIIGSTHFAEVDADPPLSVDDSEERLQKLVREHFAGDYYRLARHYYELEATVYDRLHCDFIGHFDLVTRFNDSLHFLDENDPRYTAPALEAMEYLVSKGVPFEINCGAVNRNRKKELYPNRFLLKALKDFGGDILINSDAHQKELLNGGFDIAVETAIECGFTHTNILTRKGTGSLHWEQIALDSL